MIAQRIEFQKRAWNYFLEISEYDKYDRYYKIL